MIYLSEPDYLDIRVALGLAPDDYTTLPDLTIERRMFLPEAERLMGIVLADCAVTYGDDADDDTQIEQAVVLLTASLLARGYLARQKGDQVKSHTVGPVKVDYEGGQDWMAQACDLRYQAAEAMAPVCEDAVLPLAGAVFAVIDDWSDSDPDAVSVDA